MSEYSVLEALRDEQNTLLTLAGQARQAHLPEAALLEWALETVVTAYRQHKAGEISWLEAAQAFQAASNAQMECENALFEYSHANDALWQVAKAAAFRIQQESRGG